LRPWITELWRIFAERATRRPRIAGSAAEDRDDHLDILLWMSLVSFLLWLFHSYAVRNLLKSVWRLINKFVLAT
jgi:biopolymer transport protein ExbB/TolQ